MEIIATGSELAALLGADVNAQHLNRDAWSRRYELLCNLPGRHTAGMYTELDVAYRARRIGPGVSPAWQH